MWRGGVGVTVHELLAEVRTVLELLRLFFFHGSEISDADRWVWEEGNKGGEVKGF